ncbi:MAG: AraC family transcriptional regulator [Bacteroidales bacterium]|nr:AraC family transcriptional regulator [Bacteroidales bacterium]
MRYKIFAVIIFFTLCFCGCERIPVQQQEEENPAYSPDTLRKIASENFDDVILYVLKGEKNGDISAYKANYLCAQLTYQYTPNNLTAIKYCQNALLALNIKDNYKDRVEVLYLLSNVAYAELDLNTSIKAALEGKAVAHKHQMAFEEASFDYIVGRCRFNMGEMEGLEVMRESIERARKVAEKRIEFGHLVFFVGDLTLCYATLGHSEISYMNNLLSELDVHERIVNEMENRFPQAKNYCDRNRYQITFYRAVAYATLGNLNEGDKYMKQSLTTRFAYTDQEHYRHIEYYAEIGNLDSVMAISNKFPYEGDTVQRTFRRELTLLEIAYRKAGEIDKADAYAKRIEAISELIDQREMQEGLAVNAVKYETQNYRLAFDDHEKSMQKLHLMLAVIAIIIITFVLLMALIHKKRTNTMEDYMIGLKKQMSKIANKQEAQKANEKANRSLNDIVEGQKLYLKKDISRSVVSCILGCSQHTLTKMLDEIEPDLSFPDYIRNLRIKHAIKLIKDNPNISVQQVADDSGFYSLSAFERSFKAVTGMTPKTFIKNN